MLTPTGGVHRHFTFPSQHLAFPKGPPLIFFLFTPVVRSGYHGKKIKSSFFLTFFALSDAPRVGVPKVRAPPLHLRRVILSGTPHSLSITLHIIEGTM